jgi:biopolymer transport protein ExbD
VRLAFLASLSLLAASCADRPPPPRAESPPIIALPPPSVEASSPAVRELSPEEKRAANLPPPDDKELSLDHDPITIALSAGGQLHVNGRPLRRERLQEIARQAVARRPALGALLLVDRSVPYADVIKLMDELRGAGIQDFSLGVQPEAPPAPPGP